MGQDGAAGGGPGDNGEGIYSERNDLGYNQYFTVRERSIAGAGQRHQFLLSHAGLTGGTYHFWVDQQPNTTGDAGNHNDLNYPPMIAATTAHAGDTYQVTVALGNPLVNDQVTDAPADVELDFTLNAGTYYEPSGIE